MTENIFYFSHGSPQLIEKAIADRMVQKVSSREVTTHHLYQKALNTPPNRKLKLRLMQELQTMMDVEETFAAFLNTTVENLHVCKDGDSHASCYEDVMIPKDFDCLRSLMQTYRDNCGPFTSYANNFIKYLVRECEMPTMPLS